MANDSSLYRMADRLAGGELDTILRRMKADGDSYGTISKRLYAEHGIDVTAQTVGNWLTEIEKATATEAAS